MRRLPCLLLLLAVGCSSGATTGNTTNVDEPEVRELKHERFLVHPTVVRARSIRAIFPMSYRDRIEVGGLSAGWREEAGRRIWEGTGEAEVRLEKLVLSGRSITVTLVPDQSEPEVQVQADGGVSFGHRVRGLTTEWEGKEFLWIRNDRWMEK